MCACAAERPPRGVLASGAAAERVLRGWQLRGLHGPGERRPAPGHGHEARASLMRQVGKAHEGGPAARRPGGGPGVQAAVGSLSLGSGTGHFKLPVKRLTPARGRHSSHGYAQRQSRRQYYYDRSTASCL
jgi:hypothetical protein